MAKASVQTETARIPRHKTAIRRGDFSRPVKCALRDGLLAKSVTVLDYGCGRGEDLERLTAEGYTAIGWDPVYRSQGDRQPSELVNLGYVINVIEDPDERADVVRAAWALSTKVLVASAQVSLPGRGSTSVQFGDGVLTTRGTFQKYFEQGELKQFLETTLGEEAFPADLGIFYVFRDAAARELYLSSRHRRRTIVPRKKVADRLFEENRELIDAFIATATELGRRPEEEEFDRSAEVVERFGSFRRAFALVERLTGPEVWEQAAKSRRDDLMVYLALSRFSRRPKLQFLPDTLKRDIRVFFGSYAEACKEADALLFRVGDATAIDEACRRAAFGKILPDALYVHRDGIDRLDPVLRVYEGCARAYLGEVEGANIVKLHRHSGKVSYLSYPGFDREAHPSLVRGVKLSLRTRELDCYEYQASANPPILHRKETFLPPDDPRRARFERLTKQEEKVGLLGDTATIGTRNGWITRLAEHGFTVRGHTLAKSKALPKEGAASDAE